MRNYVLPLRNAFSFFVTYARIDQWTPVADFDPASLTNVLDRWVVGELEQLIKDQTALLDGYDLQQSSRLLGVFLDNLTNRYIRRSRRRFWKSESDTDKNDAYQTLYYVLKEYSRVVAPFMPFLAEYIYKELDGEGMSSGSADGSHSVHLLYWPECREDLFDADLSVAMAQTQHIVKM
jgi:isoleucyl-tRNA synthetase